MRAILVTGFGNTGSTAITDLLRECDGFVSPVQEFFLVQHPDGIMALEDALVHSWSEFGPDWALRRFRKLIDVLARPASWFQFGMSYTEHFGADFKALSERYIDQLAAMKYEGHLMFRRAEMNRLEHFLYTLSGHPRLARLQPVRRKVFGKLSFVPDHAAFLRHTQEYTEKLLTSTAKGTNATNVALLVGTSPYQVARSSAYFPSAATIIVDRDPRDVYLSALASSYMPRDLDQFIQWYDRTRANAKVGPQDRAMKIFFEDLVTNYDASVAKMFAFLEIEPKAHARKGKFFDAAASKKRIGKWKSYSAQEEIRRIEKELAPYLWNA